MYIYEEINIFTYWSTVLHVFCVHAKLMGRNYFYGFMEQKAKELRNLVDRLQQELSSADKNLKTYVGYCQHNFGKPAYDPICTPAYRIAGDPPGTMGVDWQGPMDVPAQTTKRWKRECGTCGEVQYTTRVQEVKHEIPDFGSFS